MKKIFSSLLCLSLIMGVFASVASAAESTQFKKGIPVIDGKIDSIWSSAEANKVTKVFRETHPESEEDFSGQFRGLWDEDYLYLLVEITDDLQVSAVEEAHYKNDGIEIFYDVLNEKKTSYAGSDTAGVVLIYYPSEDGEVKLGGWHGDPRADHELDEIQASIADSQGGYIIETAIPWTIMNTGENTVGKQIGLDFVFDDSDTPEQRDTALLWSNPDGTQYKDPSKSGTVELVAGDSVPSNPKTGDTGVFLYVFIAFLSCVIFISVMTRKRCKN